MRITICAYDAAGNIDGPTSWLKRLLPFLKSNDVTVRIIFIGAKSNKSSFLNEIQAKGFEYKFLPWELFLEEKIITILKDLRDHPPDVFVPNYFPAACYAARYVKKAGIPSLIILHNDNEMHHALVDEFVSSKETGRLAAVVGVSKFITRKIEEKQTQGVVVEFITYGAPVPASYVVRKAGDPLKLIYAGRLTEHQKRISDVTQALCRVAREISGTECIIYGTGDAVQNVLAIIERNGQGLPVSYGGVLKSNEVQQHFLQNHVYILLSDYEGLPISMMEAMACGLVPVCTDIRSGIGEVIQHGRNGFLVNDRGAGFTSIIKQLKDDPQLWENCARAARETIIKDYSEEACNKKWLELLKKLAAMNTYSGVIQIPAANDLKKLTVRNEFKSFDNRMISTWRIPFYRLKKKMGRLKRDLFG